MALQEYKCPCCGGAIVFQTETQKMECPYCNTEYDVASLRDFDESLRDHDNMSWQSAAGKEWEKGETDGMRVYTCTSCGGEIIATDTLAATSCPYCGNPVIMMGQFTGALKPDCVIPFQYNKQQAKEAFFKHLSHKHLLPKIFKSENHIDEIKGVYVPFWLFDTDVDARMHYRTTRVHTWSDSRFIYTETSHFSVLRAGNISFDHIPVDGSSQMPDDLMESIEPFDFSKAVDFQTAYLSGFFAEKYDVGEEESSVRAGERVKVSTQEEFAATVRGYATVVPQGGSIQLHNGVANYALYPVWLLQTTWKDKKFTFAMNGQTGKMVGNLPLDKAAYFKWLLSLTGIVAAVVFAVGYLSWLL